MPCCWPGPEMTPHTWRQPCVGVPVRKDGVGAILITLFAELHQRHPDISLGLAVTADEERGGRDGRYERDLKKIAAEEELDGLYIVRSNVEPELFDADQTVRAYKDLSKAERAFRSMKTVDLKVRPIYHRRADRVRAHVLLCMLAYYVEWHMRSELAPVLFDDHDPEAAQQQRSSVVRPAQRSPRRHRRRRPGSAPLMICRCTVFAA